MSNLRTLATHASNHFPKGAQQVGQRSAMEGRSLFFLRRFAFSSDAFRGASHHLHTPESAAASSPLWVLQASLDFFQCDAFGEMMHTINFLSCSKDGARSHLRILLALFLAQRVILRASKQAFRYFRPCSKGAASCERDWAKPCPNGERSATTARDVSEV